MKGRYEIRFMPCDKIDRVQARYLWNEEGGQIRQTICFSEIPLYYSSKHTTMTHRTKT